MPQEIQNCVHDSDSNSDNVCWERAQYYVDFGSRVEPMCAAHLLVEANALKNGLLVVRKIHG